MTDHKETKTRRCHSLVCPPEEESQTCKGEEKSKRVKVVVDFGNRKLRLVEERLLISQFFTHVLNAPPNLSGTEMMESFISLLKS
mmetsp:Transcript_1033/g.1996  ORF Transcript_1033/g.1996 Transcript_1033/m.1996 type:complete len:85 (+) Transcript_1033:44-298(+)